MPECLVDVRARNRIRGETQVGGPVGASLLLAPPCSDEVEAQRPAAKTLGLPVDPRVPVNMGRAEGHESRRPCRTSLRRRQVQGRGASELTDRLDELAWR